MSTKLFVYGTLMRGQLANSLLQGSTFVGETETSPEFEMRDLGSFPAIYQGESSRVRGEVYEVPDDQLDDILWYEGGLYEMVDIKTSLGFCKAFLVPLDTAKVGKLIPGGDWRYR